MLTECWPLHSACDCPYFLALVPLNTKEAYSTNCPWGPWEGGRVIITLLWGASSSLSLQTDKNIALEDILNTFKHFTPKCAQCLFKSPAFIFWLTRRNSFEQITTASKSFLSISSICNYVYYVRREVLGQQRRQISPRWYQGWWMERRTWTQVVCKHGKYPLDHLSSSLSQNVPPWSSQRTFPEESL